MGKGYKIRKNYITELKEFIERDFKIVATKRNNEIDFSINDHKIKIETWANGTLDSEQTCGYMVYLEDVYYCFYGYGVYDNKDMPLKAFVDYYNDFFKIELTKIIDNYYKLIPDDLVVKSKLGCGAGLKEYIEEDEDSEEEYSEEESTDEN